LIILFTNLKGGEILNKRQIKKRNKITTERFKFFNKHIMMCGRKNGKTSFIRAIHKACLSKRHKLFKTLKKTYKKFCISVDWSNGKDYSVKTTYKISNGVIKVLNSEVLS
jgi:hypothetical protein